MIYWAILLLSSSVSAAQAPGATLGWALGGHSVEGEAAKARVFGAYGTLKLRHQISSELAGRAALTGEFENGANNSWVSSEFAPKNRFKLREALLEWRPPWPLKLQAGAIRQKGLYSPLLFQPSGAVLSLEQESVWTFSRGLGLSLRFQQSIPNSSDRFKAPHSVRVKIPSFFSETVGFSFTGKRLSWGLSGTWFAFDNLSNASAHQSLSFGNTVLDQSSSESARFAYRFRGHLLKGESRFEFAGGVNLWGRLHYLRNERTPKKRGQGWLAQMGVERGNLALELESFANQSDSSPGLYNEKRYGHNNRRGHGVGLTWRMPSKGYLVNVRVRKLEVLDRFIAAALHQSDSTFISLSLASMRAWKLF